MRRLIDEVYPPAIAEQFRDRGRDVSAVTDRIEIPSCSDANLFALAQQERRAVVTDNVADFVPLADVTDHRREAHHGLVLVDPAQYPRGARGTIGRLVRALDQMLPAHPAAQSTSARHWL